MAVGIDDTPISYISDLSYAPFRQVLQGMLDFHLVLNRPKIWGPGAEIAMTRCDKRGRSDAGWTVEISHLNTVHDSVQLVLQICHVV